MSYNFRKMSTQSKTTMLYNRTDDHLIRTHTHTTIKNEKTRTKCLYQCNGEDGCFFTYQTSCHLKMPYYQSEFQPSRICTSLMLKFLYRNDLEDEMKEFYLDAWRLERWKSIILHRTQAHRMILEVLISISYLWYAKYSLFYKS